MGIWKTEDANGNSYTKVGGGDPAHCIICINGKNTLYKGKVNISLRRGNGTSKFGQEVVMQFKIESQQESYDSSSPWDHIEFYLPEDIGKNYMTEMAHICGGNIKPFNYQDWLSVHCEKCGKQAYCPDCQKFIWRKKDELEVKDKDGKSS